MRRAEDERKEETWILSYWESGAGRGGGSEEEMVWLCWERDEEVKREKGQRGMSGRASCPLAWQKRKELCYYGKGWASAEVSNRAFRDDSEVQNKSLVTMEHESAQSQSRLCLSLQNLIMLSVWRSDSHNSSSQNNFSLLRWRYARLVFYPTINIWTTMKGLEK